MSLDNLNKDGIALDGMDPVSYYNDEGLAGSSEYTFVLRDKTYYFANEANLELFQKDPAKYIPDFAGSYLRHTDATQSEEMNTQHQNNSSDPAYLENRGMLGDQITPIEGEVDTELRNNPGFETEDEVEQSNLSDSEA